uniref:Uncharacterized protein n=1 Tax=Romanomermis culicivorax TaxID=13658 RepID=A0A915IHK8_ROMCU
MEASWLSRMIVTMLLTTAIASLCSMAEFKGVNTILLQYAQLLDEVTHTMPYACIWYHPDGSPMTHLIEWINCIPEKEPAFDQDPRVYICNSFTLRLIIFNEDLRMETELDVVDINYYNYINNLH